MIGPVFEQILEIDTEIDGARVNIIIKYHMKKNNFYQAYKFLMSLETQPPGCQVYATNLVEHFS